MVGLPAQPDTAVLQSGSQFIDSSEQSRQCQTKWNCIMKHSCEYRQPHGGFKMDSQTLWTMQLKISVRIPMCNI